ncbi:VI polysaccharide biosynthesis protein VipA/tviB [Aliivibrio fischeri MJ11]|uniref:VI polysaccharide biosynthesis protein VipA/tviB n=1 Tax=Aliivibrio fischeri (strain MJ11) TaxID=388396 RepID=B5FFU5_ALIFM|nr:nucleotide sugar dehydrogenase [Aliivibrio fischeri]ACH65154.1 VI polysaccharide biosynthesis protein VipA/tviB [Aliivibrio fischeri MJ11]
MLIEDSKIAIVGLGYVGLPLALEFGKKYQTIGYDLNERRISELKNNIDVTLECTTEEIKSSKNITFSFDIKDIENCNVYIVTVPTPITEFNQPDLGPLISASRSLGGILKSGDIVIYESTVYPGATEEVCVPELEKFSGLKYNKDFYAGYSPERINPGDKLHRVANIHKVTSGSTAEVANFVDTLYSSVITAGTHKTTSIKVAEASKLIENIQRDVNIALVNELHQIFGKLGINTRKVIDAASTKWNFMKLYPGLVGGHCISVDPYYMLHKSSSIGYIPDMIRTAREVNNGMSDYLASDFIEELVKKKIDFAQKKIVILGFAFKENCPDLRNTKVYNLYLKLTSLGLDVTIYDPLVDVEEAEHEYSVSVTNKIDNCFDIAFLAVSHDGIIESIEKEFNFEYIYDFKNSLNINENK